MLHLDESSRVLCVTSRESLIEFVTYRISDVLSSWTQIRETYMSCHVTLEKISMGDKQKFID